MVDHHLIYDLHSRARTINPIAKYQELHVAYTISVKNGAISRGRLSVKSRLGIDEFNE